MSFLKGQTFTVKVKMEHHEKSPNLKTSHENDEKEKKKCVLFVFE